MIKKVVFVEKGKFLVICRCGEALGKCPKWNYWPR
jgi:CDGSH-type Zn-finger protein